MNLSCQLNLARASHLDAAQGRNFTLNNSHFTFISHLPFNKQPMLNAKLLKIDNCKLLIASAGGSG